MNLITLSALFITASSPAHANAELYLTTSPVSEEQVEATCPSGYALHGIQCYGDYCDNKVLFCKAYFDTEDTGASTHFLSGTFSEEEPHNKKVVTGGGFVTGLRCFGDYCDNMQLAATETQLLTALPHSRWTESFSEERMGPMMCESGEIVTGIRCLGDYCDNLQLQCSKAKYMYSTLRE